MKAFYVFNSTSPVSSFLSNNIARLCMLCMVMFAGWRAEAQVNTKYTYTPNSTNATFTAISSGTTICSGANVSGTTSNAWYQGAAVNTSGAGIPIGFSFTYNCISYTTIGVHTNAFLWFGTGSPAASTVAPLSNASANLGGSGTIDGLIACWAGDAASTPRIPIGASSYIRYTVSGLSPNRIFKIEWGGYKITGANNGSALIPSSQIWLYETSNNIEMYFNSQNGILINGNRTGQIGIRGTSNADFKNLKLTTALNAGNKWTSIPAGTLNTDNVTTSSGSSIWPGATNTQHRVVAFNFTGSCCTPPTAPGTAPGATSFATSNITPTTVDVGFTRGDGTGGVLVVARANATSAVAPSNGSGYAVPGASLAYNSGQSTTGTNNFIVYNGTANGTNTAITPFTVTGLTAGTTYAFDIYEYNTVSTCYAAALTGTVLVQTPCTGTPNVGTSTPGSSSLCPNGSTTITNNASNPGVSGIIFQWQVSSTGGAGTFSNVSQGTGATSQSYGTGALANATANPIVYYFQCVVTCQASGQSDTAPASGGIAITVNPTPVVTINGSSAYTTSICSTGSPNNIVLTASNSSAGTTTYGWTPTTGLSASTGASVTANPSTTTTYTVTGTANTCTGQATAAITVNPGTVTVTPSSATIGVGGSTSLTASATSGNPGTITYAWSPATGLNTTTGATVTASPLSTTIYTVTATDAAGCSRSTTVTVTVSSGSPGSVSCGYTFAYNTNTYAAASTLGTPTVVASGAGIDNSVYANQPIGFSFNFNDATYTTFGISSNTFIWFGTGTRAPSTTNFTPLSSTTGETGTGTIDGIASVFGMDNAAFNSSAKISVVTYGSVGSRVCVIEWSQFIVAKDDAASCIFSYPYGNADFQIRLFEGTNQIQFRYFMASNDLTAASGNQPDGGQVGVRGATTADFNTRSVPCASLTWATSAAGTATSLCYISGGCSCSAKWPANNATYNWNVTTKPTITPAAQQNICTGGAGVTLTAVNSGGMSSPAYQWQIYTYPPSNTNISGETNTTYFTNPPTPGNYFYTVRLTSGTCVRNSDAIAVVVAACGFNINSSTGANGTISPLGNTNVNSGANQSYTITADACYQVGDVLVDGVSVGAVTTYTFTNVTATHTISVTFIPATEICNGIDDDCDTFVDEGFDVDGDTYTTCAGDCNDGNAAVNPGATEVCNGIDDDCDGLTDEGFDVDGDTYTTCAGDCNDGNAAVHPGATEVCNGIDDDCDGLTDEGFDVDGDTYTTCAGDCNDGNAAVNPGATEVCNGIDDDCDGLTDEGFDVDGDTYTTCAGDCNDGNAAVHPGATEVCNGIDDDCDGLTDEGFDVDGDGYTTCAGDCNDANAEVYPGAEESCNGYDDNCDGFTDEGWDFDGDGYTLCQGDCDNMNAAIHPGAADICNGIDDDCDGTTDEGVDNDGDGITTCQGDCDDNNNTIGNQIVWYGDLDGDGWGSYIFTTQCTNPGLPGVILQGGDCDDTNAAIHPSGVEICQNNVDDDCDGLIDEDCSGIPNDNFADAQWVNNNAYPQCQMISGTCLMAAVSPQGNPLNVLPSGGRDVWYKFVAPSTAVQVKVNPNGFDAVIELKSNAVTELNVENLTGVSQPEILNYVGLTVGTTYYVAVRNYQNTNGGTFNICVSPLMNSYCADGSGTYDLCTNFKSVWTGANNYTYNFTPTGMTPGSPSAATGGGQMPLSTVALGLRHLGTYNVTISGVFNLLNGLGNPEVTIVPGIAVCSISIAPHVAVEVKPAQWCPVTLLKNTLLQGKPFVCSAIQYKVEFTQVTDCGGAVINGIPFEVTTTGSSSTVYLNFSYPMPLTNNSYYKVRFKPMFSYGPGQWGTPRVIRIGGAVMEEVVPLLEEMEGAERAEMLEASPVLFPNPNRGDMINIAIPEDMEGAMDIRIIDQLGRNVYSGRYVVASSQLLPLVFETPLANGLYCVEMIIDNRIVTEKITVQK